MHLRVLLIISLFCILFSCKKEEPISTKVTSEQDYSSVKVTVKHVYSFNPTEDSTVANVRVRLFTSKELRDENITFDAERYTNIAGEVEITHRQEEYYYIRTDHPAFGTKFKEVSTPAGSYSFVEVLYY